MGRTCRNDFDRCGSFFFPPFGLIIIPFLAVFITELCIKAPKDAFLVGVATVVGFKQYSSESHSPNHYDYHICLLYYLLTIPIAGWF